MVGIFLFIGLLFASAFFSGVEIAFFSLSKIRVKHLVEKKRHHAECLAALKEDPHRLLITLLVGNNIVNIAAAAVATALAIDYFGSAGVGIATAAVTFAVLIFGEITPKSIATRHAELIALYTCRIVRFLMYVFYPVIIVLDFITRLFTKVAGDPLPSPTVTEEEMRHIVKVGAEEGEIKKMEREMIDNVFEFDEIVVREIMTPRPDIVAIDINDTKEAILKTLKKSQYSRIPVYDGKIDNIVGILFTKDLLSCLGKNVTKRDIEKAIRKAFIVPETKPGDDLLTDFRRTKNIMAIIVDEFGAVAGIITIEDLLEEIVGEIYDEKDKVLPQIRKLSHGAVIVDASLEIAEVNEQLNLWLSEDEDYTTLGGLVLDRLGHIPHVGERVELRKAWLVVEQVDKNRIIQVRIVPKEN